MFNLEKTLKSAIGFLELGMLDGASNEIECIPPEHKKFLCCLMCEDGNLSIRKAVGFDGGGS